MLNRTVLRRGGGWGEIRNSQPFHARPLNGYTLSLLVVAYASGVTNNGFTVSRLVYTDSVSGRESSTYPWRCVNRSALDIDTGCVLEYAVSRYPCSTCLVKCTIYRVTCGQDFYYFFFFWVSNRSKISWTLRGFINGTYKNHNETTTSVFMTDIYRDEERAGQRASLVR